MRSNHVLDYDIDDIAMYYEDQNLYLDSLENLRMLKLLHEEGLDLSITHKGLPNYVDQYNSYDTSGNPLIFCFAISFLLEKYKGYNNFTKVYQFSIQDYMDEDYSHFMDRTLMLLFSELIKESAMEVVLLLPNFFPESKKRKINVEPVCDVYQMNHHLVIISEIIPSYFDLMEKIFLSWIKEEKS